jgi:cysteine-rich secretory family protein
MLSCSRSLTFRTPARPARHGKEASKLGEWVLMCKRALLLWAIVSFGGCGGSDEAGGPSGPTPAPYASEMAACLAQANQYRASVGLAPLARSTDLEAYATNAAQNDGAAHAPHQYFTNTNGGGIALAENEIPWWSLVQLGSVAAVVQRGLGGMWGEGPGGGHYRNIVGPYTTSGCGVAVSGDEVTVVQAFH